MGYEPISLSLAYLFGLDKVKRVSNPKLIVGPSAAVEDDNIEYWW